MFKSIEIKEWRQYKCVQIDLHDKLTIITGANGSGKTTILNLFARHFGWQTRLTGTFKEDKTTGGFKFFADIWSSIFGSEQNTHRNIQIGYIEYSGGQKSNLEIPSNVGSTYDVLIPSQSHLSGLHIPSHRPIYSYQLVPNIATTPISRSTAYQNYRNIKQQRFSNRPSPVLKSETYFIKETLISLATFGYGNKIVNENRAAIELFEGFERVLKNVLPPKLGFQSIAVRIPEVVLITDSGEFAIDAVSGGIASIIDLAWQIYMYESSDKPFCITIDEPENHLHPEMQRTLLPNFMRAFPNAQFIVVTHNPFIISSVSDSKVYVLDYDEDNKVKSFELEDVEKSGNANEILREVLGIESTKPDWVNEKLETIITKYSSEGITADNIANFKRELKEIGLDRFIHTSVADLIEKSKGNDSANETN